MPLPEPLNDLTAYEATLQEYNQSAGIFSQANAARNEKFTALQSAESEYNSANAAAEAAASDAAAKLAAHTEAASAAGVAPAVGAFGTN